MQNRHGMLGRTLGISGVVFAVLAGLGMPAPAKAKQKPWSPPIPAGREVITLTIRSTAKVPTQVTWGRRLLGETPLILKWPRDSGPVDIVVQAKGYVSVQTRLYTFANDKVVVKLVTAEEKKTLFGYKREVPAIPSAPNVTGTAPTAIVPTAIVPTAIVPTAIVPTAIVPTGSTSSQ